MVGNPALDIAAAQRVSPDTYRLRLTRSCLLYLRVRIAARRRKLKINTVVAAVNV
jgi:hypothetical protein